MSWQPRDPGVDAALASAAPRVPQASDPELAAALESVRDGIVATPRAVPLRRRRMLVAVGLAAVLVIGSATATMAHLLSARTGEFGAAGMTENDTSEWLRTDAPDFDQVVDHLGAAMPLPPGGDWARAKRGLHSSGPSRIQVSGVEGQLAFEATCQWARYWLAGQARGDARQMARAQHVLDQIPGWRQIRGVDGGGIADSRRELAAAASRGNAAAVRAWATTYDCAITGASR
jgi:hypothetical protein